MSAFACVHSLVAEREYVGSVKQMAMNENYAAVLCEGKVKLSRCVHSN